MLNLWGGYGSETQKVTWLDVLVVGVEFIVCLPLLAVILIGVFLTVPEDL